MKGVMKDVAKGVNVLTTDEAVPVPRWYPETLAEFRRWAANADNGLPEKTRTDFYKGEVWIDMGLEEVFTHGAVKTEFAFVLVGLAKQNRLGRYFANGVLVTNKSADLSGNPDGTFISYDAVTARRVSYTVSKRGRRTEIVGTPDMVLEVVSPSSVRKDTVRLRGAYWEAGIPEYWLVDARGDTPAFHILKRGPKGYTETRAQAGWLKSNVFGKSFKLTRGADPNGDPEFTLHVQ
jgi:Uma2 family endonuclease